MQSIIHSFKYAGMPRLAVAFGRLLGEEFALESKLIIPVPLHRTRRAERGYNQAEMLAKGIQERRGWQIVPALRRTRATPSQTQLSVPERIENMRGAFALTRHAADIQDKHILLVDDVMTTGSTLASAAEALLAARPKSISTLTLAVVQK